MNDDRRKFIRYDIPLDVQFKIFDDSSDYFAGVTANFSRSGLCLSSEVTSPSLRDAIDIRLKLPDSDTFITAIGDIVWKKEHDNSCSYGVRLMAMEAEAKSIILETAYNNWLNKKRSEV